jgi:hypothetical protein
MQREEACYGSVTPGLMALVRTLVGILHSAMHWLRVHLLAVRARAALANAFMVVYAAPFWVLASLRLLALRRNDKNGRPHGAQHAGAALLP